MNYENARDIYRIMSELAMLAYQIQTIPGWANRTQQEKDAQRQAQMDCQNAGLNMKRLLNAAQPIRKPLFYCNRYVECHRIHSYNNQFHPPGCISQCQACMDVISDEDFSRKFNDYQQLPPTLPGPDFTPS